MHTLPVYALNFEILKFSAAPETLIFILRVFNIVGWTTLLLHEPLKFIIMSRLSSILHTIYGHVYLRPVFTGP